MWDWFIANAVWILVISAVVLSVLLIARQQVRASIEKAVPKKWLETLHNSINLALLVIGGISLMVIILALAAITLSREGAHVIITPETIQRWFLQHGIFILIIIVISFLAYRFVKFVMPEVVERSVRMRGRGRRAREELTKRSRTLSSLLTYIILVIILVAALFMILSEVGVDVTPLLAGAGVAGVAIGFGAQSLVRDILNGLFILLEDQYNRGDVVRIAGIAGIVEELNLRRTVLRDLDGLLHTIPNGEVKTSSNFTKDWSRAHLNISVAYKEDLDKAMSTIRKAWEKMAEHPKWSPMLISKTPWLLRVDAFGDSGIVIKVVGETKPMTQWDVMGELRRRIKIAFDKAGIEIPWPHVKLYFGEQPADKGLTCPACSHINPPGSKFCAHCGASLGSR